MSELTNTIEALLGHMLHEADHAATVDFDGRTWFDVRSLTDPRERSAHQIDIAQEAIDLGIRTGLLARHPQQQHLVCATRRTAAAPNPLH